MWRGSLCNMKLILMPFILGLSLALPSQEPPAPRPHCIRMTPETERQIDLIVEKLGDFLNNLTIEHEDFDIRLIKLSIEQHTEDEVEEKETVLQLSVNDCKMSDDELEEIDHHREKAKQVEKEREEKLKEEQRKEEKSEITDAREQKSGYLKNEQGTQEDNKNLNDHEQTKEGTPKNEGETQTCGGHLECHVQKVAENTNNHQGKQVNNENSDVYDEAGGNSNEEHENQDTDKPETADQNENEYLQNNDEDAKSGKNFEVMYLDLDEKGQKLLEAMGKKKKGPRIVYVQERNSGQTEYWFLKRR